MQETQYGLRLAEDDKRWMTFAGLSGDADLNSVLAPLHDNFVGASGLDATPQPESELSVALVNVSVDINALTLEQVRLRETLETLNSTLFITGDSLAIKTVDTRSVTSGSEQKEPAPVAGSWVDKGLEMGADAGKFVGKELMSSVWDTLKSRVSGKAIDKIAEKIPSTRKWLKDDSKGKDCCCPGEPLLAPKPPNIFMPPDNGRAGEQKNSGKRASSGSGKKTGKVRTLLRGVFDGLSKAVFGDSRASFHAGTSALAPFSSRQGLGNGGAKNLGLIGALERGVVAMPGDAGGKTHNTIQTSVPTSRPAPAAHSPGVPTSRLAGAMTRLESFGARRLGPLKYADTAVDLIQGVRNGDAKAIGTGLSTAGGAWAGASAGAALGTLVFPGIGTAVGGAIGGLLGSEAGSWLGDKLFGASDRLPAPNTVSKALNSARTDSVQVTIAPSIQITGVNPADAQQVVNQVIQALQFQCMPMVTDSLGIRRNAALADPGGD